MHPPVATNIDALIEIAERARQRAKKGAEYVAANATLTALRFFAGLLHADEPRECLAILEQLGALTERGIRCGCGPATARTYSYRARHAICDILGIPRQRRSPRSPVRSKEPDPVTPLLRLIAENHADRRVQVQLTEVLLETLRYQAALGVK